MTKKLRILYGALFCAIFLTEVMIALFVHDRFIRPYFGDVLVTVLLCCFFRIFIPTRVRLLCVYVFIFAALVELGQYFDMVHYLGLGNSKFFCTLLGTSFSHYDLICYAAGCALFFGMECLIRKRTKTTC